MWREIFHDVGWALVAGLMLLAISSKVAVAMRRITRFVKDKRFGLFDPM